MKFTAVDIECDQPSGDIIQIGAAAFDTDQDEVPYQRFIGFPDIERPINWEYELERGDMTLGDLIPWSDNYYNGVKEPAEKVYRDFWFWFMNNGAGKKIIQWGGGDVREIIKQGVGWRGKPPRHFVFDAKSTYKFLIQPVLKLPKGHGLGSAMETFKIPWTDDPHDALADAIAAGRCYAKMIDILDRYRMIMEIVK